MTKSTANPALYALHHLATHLKPSITVELTLDTSNHPAKAPLFVTFKKHGNLRGCIGTFSPLPLIKGIETYSLTAALQDSRFVPIKASELESLTVGVTLLQDFEDADAWDDWELGVHGIRISFEEGGRTKGATFLPEVAIEQGWNKTETLQNLIAKAGGSDKVALDRVDVVRYRGVKSKSSWDEYRKLVLQ